MQPYERPRSGELAGTAGSTPSILPTPAETVPPEGRVGQAAGPPSQTARMIFDEPPSPGNDARATPLAPESPGRAVGTSGTSEPRRPARVRIGGIPQGTNSVFIEYQGRRWYPTGPAARTDTTRLTRLEDYQGFPVWADPENAQSIYIPSIRGGALVVPYSATRQR